MKTVTSVYIHSSEKSCFVQKGHMVPICLHCLNCTKFGQLILRKTIKIVATTGQILRLKCTKFDFGWGLSPYSAGGAYSAPPDPLAGFKGPTSKGWGGEGEEGGEREGGFAPPSRQLWIRPCSEVLSTFLYGVRCGATGRQLPNFLDFGLFPHINPLKRTFR